MAHVAKTSVRDANIERKGGTAVCRGGGEIGYEMETPDVRCAGAGRRRL